MSFFICKILLSSIWFGRKNVFGKDFDSNELRNNFDKLKLLDPGLSFEKSLSFLQINKK